jgi:nucleotide-binding universal stress UspA family protein
MKKILIALDDGPSSKKVASMGLQLGQQLHAEIALISIVDTTDLMNSGGITPR